MKRKKNVTIDSNGLGEEGGLGEGKKSESRHGRGGKEKKKVALGGQSDVG